MKKLVLMVSAFVIVALNSNAQNKLEIGMRFNPEFSGIMNSNDAAAGEELNLKPHFSALSFGAGATYNFNNHIGLGVDLLFSREGQAYSGTFTNGPRSYSGYNIVVARQLNLNDQKVAGSYEALAELNFLKIPVMISLSTDKTKKMYLTVMTGPQINFLVSVAQEVNKKDMLYQNTDIAPRDLYRPVTVSGMFALGGACNLSSRLVLSTRLRFDYGLQDIEKKGAMVSYYGDRPIGFYSSDRKAAHTFTAGLMIGLDFKI